MRKATARFALIAGLSLVVVTPATPYEIPTTPAGSWTGVGITTGSITFGAGTLAVETGTYYKTTPSGLRMTVTVDGTFPPGPPGSGSFFLSPGNNDVTNMTPSAAGTSPGPFTTLPVLPSGVNSLWMGASVFTCKTTAPTATTCNGIGTVKVRFTDPLGGAVPVVQPKIHVTKLGGTVGAMELGAGWQTNSSGLSLTSAASATLAIQNGNEFYGNPTPVGNTLNVNCGVSATTTSGCGSVQVTGTSSALDFNVNAYRTTAGANAWGDGADGFFIDMSFDEDFGSLPTSYEGGGIAAANLLTDLRLGAGITAENTTTAAHANGGVNASGMLTASPVAIASGAAPTDSADGIVFPLLPSSAGGTVYTVTPTISGASRPGTICGWIDFDKSGTFAAATEGVCQAFAAGATSAAMNFNVPNTNFAAGPTYARFRVSYDTAMTTSSFNGLFSSGETEDYQIHIKPQITVNKVVAPATDTGTFNLSINGTNFATAIANGGTTGLRSVYHTDAPDVSVATNIANAAITGVAIAETAAGATVLSDFDTTSTCVDATGAAVTTGGTAAAPTVTIPQSSGANGKAQSIICTLTNSRKAKFKIQKITLGDFGGPFAFAQTNLVSTPASITTAAVATVTPAVPTSINVTTLNTAVTFTETPAAGYALTSATCTDANSAATGNTGSIGTLAGNVLTIAAANVKASADFTCVFTNTRATLKVQKTTIGSFGGPFTFAQTNLVSAPAGITTTAVSTATPAAPTAISISAMATAVTLTETPVTGYVMTQVSCTDANSAFTGNIGTFGAFAANVVTIPAANVKSGANITCNVTNTKLPTIQVSKTSVGGVGGFTFTGTNGWASQTLTTSTAGTAVSGPIQILTASGTATTLTEAIPVDYLMTSATCSGIGSGTATPNLGAGTITLDAAATAVGNVIACSVTNSKLPTLTVRKTTTGGVNTFAFIGTNGFGSDSITTTVVATPVSGVTKTLTAAAVATSISETITSGYFLTGTPSCTGMGPGGTVTLVSGSTYNLDAPATAYGSNIICTFTNALAVPQIAIAKTSSVPSINAAGSTVTYTLAVSNPGNVTITAITVADPLGSVICPVSGNATIASLAPAASQNCTVTYVVPQLVIDNNGGGDGKIDNTATVSGSYGGTAVTANGSAAVNIIRNPLLNIVKTANPTTPQAAGALITYPYKVTNAGNVTMTGIAVSDAHNGTGVLVGPTNEALTTDTAPTGDSTDPAINGTWATLAPGDVVTFTATYTVTQHDVDFLQ